MHVPYYISIQVRNHIMVVIALDRWVFNLFEQITSSAHMWVFE
jgi:hypothetical protein